MFTVRGEHNVQRCLYAVAFMRQQIFHSGGMILSLPRMVAEMGDQIWRPSISHDSEVSRGENTIHARNEIQAK